MLGDEGCPGVGVGDGHKLADLSNGHSKLSEAVDDLGGRHLVEAVVAVGALGVHVGGFNQARLVVAAQRLDAQVGDTRELPDAKDCCHIPSLDPPPGGESSVIVLVLGFARTPLTLPLREA